MEISQEDSFAAWMFVGYCSDAELAAAAMQQEEPAWWEVEAASGLIRTFTVAYPYTTADARAAAAVTRLAIQAFHALDRAGAWHEIASHWPALETIALVRADRAAFFKLRLQRFILENYNGQSREAVEEIEPLVGSGELNDLDPGLQAEFFLQLGTGCLRIGNIRRAETYLGKCLQDDHASPEVRASAWNQAGNLAMMAGQFRRAEDCYRNCSRIADENNIPVLGFISRTSLGRLFLFTGKAEAAVGLLEENLHSPPAVVGKEGLAEAMVCLALAYTACGRLADGQALVSSAQAIFQPLGALYGISMCCVAQGRIHARNGQLHESCTALEKALHVSEKMKMPFLELYVLRDLVPAAFRAGRIGAGLGCTARAAGAVIRLLLQPGQIVLLCRRVFNRV